MSDCKIFHAYIDSIDTIIQGRRKSYFFDHAATSIKDKAVGVLDF